MIWMLYRLNFESDDKKVCVTDRKVSLKYLSTAAIKDYVTTCLKDGNTVQLN